jgi:hypothetical protein
MKKLYLIILCFSLVCACQLEEDTIIIDQNVQLEASSPLTSSIKRATQDSTAFDNFIDGTSKIRVNFPFQVTVNQNTTLTLDNEVRYSNLIQVLEATPQQDNIQLNFPVNVSTIDYRNQTLDSAEELALFLENIPESSEVNCVELVFPIDLRFFNPLDSSIGNVTIFNRAQFFNFLSDLDNNTQFYEIDYPVSALTETTDGTFEISINSNEDFNAVFSQLEQNCFDPLLYDNSPSGTNPTNLEAFVEFITNNFFIISELIDEGEPDDSYADLTFIFIQGDGFSGNIEIEQEIIGEWNAFLDDGVIVFELNFEDSFYGELDDDWDVVSFNASELQLIDVSSDGDTSTLVFSVVN